MNKVITTLCIVHQDRRVLLGMKKRRFGEGRWNGFGGKVLENESIEESLVREIEEEAGIQIREFEKVGVVDFELRDDKVVVEVNIFRCTDFSGEPAESEEMRPAWFHLDEIPFQNMWPTDVEWMPLFLSGRKFKGKYTLDKPSSTHHTSEVLSRELEEVEYL